MTTKNIVLVGLMGAGKTTVGKCLAQKIGYDFIDIDEIIETNAKIKISEIFKSHGEEHFRHLETQTIKSFETKEKCIISIGGGAMQKQENIDSLKKNGILFYLYAPVDVLYSRLLNEIDNRPMLHEEDPKKKLETLLAKREANYLQSHYKIDTVDQSPQKVCEEIALLI